MKKTKLTFYEALQMDELLMQLASYEINRGRIMVEQTDNFSQYPRDVARQFNYYKALIQSGESSFEEILQDVIARNAAVPDVEEPCNIEDAISKWEAEMDKAETHFSKRSDHDFARMLIEKIFDQISSTDYAERSNEPKSFGKEKPDEDLAN